ncbi:YgiQ family radical SAM protein [Seleniivibrio sp.]|uniref:YgiQ family radical SAM protein n=1 Tax=Seleniivibrio sp. TaxID=2898801 RepID=UPI0025F4E058|nr:YgiQ family radical SAM protein [Seleniivibrio sp.]MCD8552350.1 YgiQ family radical SAM protein [Seleniivibrio sp.]
MVNNTFLPVTQEEISKLGWDRPDVILVSGDTYLDSPYNGTAIIGRLLTEAGYRTAIIAQPDMDTDDIARLGEPKLFWGVSAGCVDSMVANYTASKKKRNTDDFTPGGENNRRPDRAVLAYTNLIRRHFKNTVPIVIGGIEASLRRVTHYDFWSDSLRKSVLFDSKADYLVYGMGEKSIMALADAFKNGTDVTGIRGLCYISKEVPKGYLYLPAHEECVGDKEKFMQMFNTFYKNNDPITAKGLVQRVDSRYLVQNPPSETPLRTEMNSYYELPYTYKVHPFYAKQGAVRALDTIRNSVTTHRGCYGECNFCAIAVHQGTTIAERTEASVIKEVKRFRDAENFNGIINDVGGPTANMFGMECRKKKDHGRCTDKRCLFPQKCPQMPADHRKLNSLLSAVRTMSGVRRVFVASGIRYDIIMEDKQFGGQYLDNLVNFHISGQMKIAPEHTQDSVLGHMGKPSAEVLKNFVAEFQKRNKGKKQYLTYYMIAAHPGCTIKDMEDLKRFTSKELRINPEQVQIFTPLPSTYSALMYYTGKDPFTGKDIFVEKSPQKRQAQKDALATADKQFKPKRAIQQVKKRKGR